MNRTFQLSLQKRFSYTLGGMAIFVALIVGLFGQYYNERLELQIWRSTLESEFAYFKQNIDQYPDKINKQTGNLWIYKYKKGEQPDKRIPNIYYQLDPGIYDEVTIGNREYCVLVRNLEDGRVLLAYDITDLEDNEFKIGLVAMGIIVLAIIFIVYTSHILGRKLIAPIKNLANSVSILNPKDRGLKLSDDYKDNELSVIAQAIDYYLQKLDSFVEREREFLDTASHELRTPISIISGAADILNAQQGMSNVNERAVARIKNAARDMTETMNLLFVLAKDTPKIASSAKPLQIDRLIETIIKDHLEVFAESKKDIQVSLEEMCIFTPREPAAIILRNLIRNAIEHSINPHVTITLKKGWLIIENQGTLTDPDEIATLFNKRVRGKNTEGNGLGLYLIKRICESLHWPIEITGFEEGKFIVKLNLSQHTVNQ